MDRILKDREVENGIIVPISLKYNDKDEPIRVTDDYIDISYKSQNTPARILSNLYPYEFEYFFGRTVNSIEAAIQSLKYDSELLREECYRYSGIDSWHLRGMTPYLWQKDGILYTPKGPVDRFSEKYQGFLNELYYFAFQNPFYRHNLLFSGSKRLDHTTGEDSPKLSTLTRTEYISRLYALRYCLENHLIEKTPVIEVLNEAREELKLKRVL